MHKHSETVSHRHFRKNQRSSGSETVMEVVPLFISMRRVLATVLVALMMVLAGCGGFSGPATETPIETPPDTPTATETPAERETPPETDTTTETPAVDAREKVTVIDENDELSFDPAVVYQRVVEMHGLDLEQAPSTTVHVEEEYQGGGLPEPGPFDSLMGMEAFAPDTGVAGLARGTDVWVYTGAIEDQALREQVLAHEFVHVLQSAQTAQQRTISNLERLGNEQFVYLSVIEGTATYAEYRYAAEYLDGDDEPLDWETVRANRTQYGAYLIAPYVYGHQYVHDRVDSIEEMEAIYDDPPQTTEQLIHGYDTDVMPRELIVTVDADASDWREAARETRGELYVRIILEGELELDRAADAAAGWGNDELVTVQNAQADRGFAWVLRWDSPADANEFEDALTDFLDGHAVAEAHGWQTDDGDAFNVVRADDETVVLMAGDTEFVERASVTAENGQVTVTVDDHQSQSPITAVGTPFSVASAGAPAVVY